MGDLHKLFSQDQAPPASHSIDTANRLLPLVIKYTEEAIQKTESLMIRIQGTSRRSKDFQGLCQAYDRVIQRWVEKIHRLGAVAKGLWLVDFDTGNGYLCWAFPEKKIEHFHQYQEGFKHRRKIT